MSTPFHGHTSRLNSPPDTDKVPSDSLLRDRVHGREAGAASHHQAGPRRAACAGWGQPS